MRILLAAWRRQRQEHVPTWHDRGLQNTGCARASWAPAKVLHELSRRAEHAHIELVHGVRQLRTTLAGSVAERHASLAASMKLRTERQSSVFSSTSVLAAQGNPQCEMRSIVLMLPCAMCVYECC